jgi:myo-inositol-1(or 4)-monophosphatase
MALMTADRALEHDWLGACRAAAEGLRSVLRDHPTSIERVIETGVTGEGGDKTLVIDAEAEARVFEELQRLHDAGARFTVVSEERGTVDFGSDELLVVVDPIDGSLNAKRGIPFFALSIAVADGDTMDDVVFGYVYDFGSGEEWTAVRGAGAFLNGRPLTGRPKDELEILSFEATTTAYVSENAARFEGVAHRLRVMGSLAITLCHLAAGRVDGVVSLKPARSVDIAAAQLLVRERGFVIDLPEASPFGAAPLDLEGRSRVAAAGNERLCRRLAEALTG